MDPLPGCAARVGVAARRPLAHDMHRSPAVRHRRSVSGRARLCYARSALRPRRGSGAEPMSSRSGHPEDLEQWFAASYAELRQLAHARLRGGARDLVLDTTALVHESFLRLSQREGVAFPDRSHFLAYASKVMRSVIVDLVRERGNERHGGDLARVTLTTGLLNLPVAAEEHILRVHEALEDLQRVDPRMAQVVEMRFFAGLNDLEIAEALQVSDRTVRRDWQQAQLFLAEALR
jgi:RNA polymerase sigma factor (TIGR02999 family)